MSRSKMCKKDKPTVLVQFRLTVEEARAARVVAAFQDRTLAGLAKRSLLKAIR
jgi:hypothetical protein